MKVITIIGTGGGVGVTTVSAQLATGLVAQSRRSIAFDFSPGNALRLHFGMGWEDETGIAPQIIAGKPWHEAAYRSASGVDFVPFGRLEDSHTVADFVAWLDKQPAWFSSRLEELDEPADTYVVCDCPRIEGALCSQVLATAHLTLIVLAPDALSYAAATASAQAALAQGAQEIVYVINGFDPARALDRDVATLMRANFQHCLVPVILHRDESLREALASKQSVFEYAPSSQATYDFAALAMWVVAHLAHAQEKAA
ncbi:MAG: cellulose biosynthesis protein BcsQ [Burkholderiales bacterium]|nr:cellulose synthase operon protein YhjQ [Sulfuricellaceae bacterium]